MSLVEQIKETAAAALEDIYKIPVFGDDILVNATKPEFEGNYTIVLFSLIKRLGLSPDKLGDELGQYLIGNKGELFTAYNVIKGFLNLTIADVFFNDFLAGDLQFSSKNTGRKVMVEYASPNTNKPLHLGHLRNIFLGWSVAEILKATGAEVFKTCIANDRGIHICKSMIAWKLYGNGKTPQSTGIKGDHFVGDYYVKCENKIKEESALLEQEAEAGNYENIGEKFRQRLTELQELLGAVTGGREKDEEKRKKIMADRKELLRANTPTMQLAQQMLVDWEAGLPEVMALWKKMNGWVYEGFDETYKRIGSDFDKTYYESNTYLPGKRFVEDGLMKNLLYKKEDGSVWINLQEEGLDEKLVLRKDGTSVYITQDLGLAEEKYRDFPYDQSIYVIADEQNYHMKVLQAILKKFEAPYADGIFHLSYGLVELPTGRMKTREGTVVDADDIMDEMVSVAAQKTEELGKVKDFDEAELKALYDVLGIGALKFFLLRVDPKKKMIFNPEESIDFHGFTGPFVQFTHARTRSILRKESQPEGYSVQIINPLLKLEKEVILLLEQYNAVINQAAAEYNPSVIAIYIFSLARLFNSLLTEHSVLSAETGEKKSLRLRLCSLTADTIKHAMGLLGIPVPERM